MYFKTLLCDLLNIEYPLIQGAMAWIAGGNLAAAVSQAGGLGVIGASGAEPAWIKQEIEQVRKLTGKPFGVNLMLAAPGIEKIIELIIQEKVPVVTTGGGNPGPYIKAKSCRNIGHTGSGIGGPGPASQPLGGGCRNR